SFADAPASHTSPLALHDALPIFKPLLGNAAGWVIAAGLGVIYVALLGVASRYPDLEMDDPEAPTMVMPQTRPTLMTGLHYILPRSEEHTSELQSRENLVCRLLRE